MRTWRGGEVRGWGDAARAVPTQEYIYLSHGRIDSSRTNTEIFGFFVLGRRRRSAAKAGFTTGFLTSPESATAAIPP
jgi:hypothetical protein